MLQNTRLILSLCELWDSSRIEESRQILNSTGKSEDIKNKIIAAFNQNSPELYPLVRVANFFDTVGSLVFEGYLDKEIAYKLMGTAFDNYNNLYSSLLRDPDHKDFLKCFQELDKIFTKVKANHEKIKVRPP